MTRQPVDFAELLARAAAIVRTPLCAKDIALSIEYPRVGLGVVGDHEVLTETIAGVLLRALESAGRGDRLVLTAVENSASVTVGVRPAHAASPSTDTLSPLAVTIPTAPLDPHARPAGSSVSRNYPRHSILVVDDNRSAAMLLGRLLEKLGQTVKVVNDPREALDCVADFAPEIVFSDISMPGMSGYELAQAIRRQELPHSPRLIALTGYGPPNDSATDGNGFDEHFVKPIGLQVLERILGPACE